MKNVIIPPTNRMVPIISLSPKDALKGPMRSGKNKVKAPTTINPDEMLNFSDSM